MGFPDKLVVKAIEEIGIYISIPCRESCSSFKVLLVTLFIKCTGEGSSEGKILDTVLTYLVSDVSTIETYYSLLHHVYRRLQSLGGCVLCQHISVPAYFSCLPHQS